MDNYQDAAIRIGAKLRVHRKARHMTLEEVSKEIGVSAATLSRWERRADGNISSLGARLPITPDIKTLEKIANWLPRDLDEVEFVVPSQPYSESRTNSTPEIIEAHLRADRNLDPKSADLLSQLVRSVYVSLATRARPIDEKEEEFGDKGSEG